LSDWMMCALFYKFWLDVYERHKNLSVSGLQCLELLLVCYRSRFQN
jgi:hypothetical protein